MKTNDIGSHVFRVNTPQGALFAKRWDSASTDAKRPPLVLMHDSLGSVELWRDFPEQLVHATKRSVVAYDRLGFGRSDPHPGQVPLDFIASEARSGFQYVKASLALERFVVVGHSVGGGMAVGIAASYPLECEGLVTMSAQAFVEDRTIAGIRSAQLAFAQSGQIERLARYHGDKAPWVLSAWLDRWLDPAFATWSLDAELPDVTCSNLVMHGSRDEYGSCRHPERIAERSSGLSTLRIGDWGHVPYREAPIEILAHLVDWSDGLSASGS